LLILYSKKTLAGSKKIGKFGKSTRIC